MTSMRSVLMSWIKFAYKSTQVLQRLESMQVDWRPFIDKATH